MSRFLSTYSSHYISPPCDEQETPEVNFPGDNCKKCSRPCQCPSSPTTPSQPTSRRSSCSSTSSRVRSIQQIDFSAVPQVRNCRCLCQCCVSKKPEPAVSCAPSKCSPTAVCLDPCCRLHKVRIAQTIAQDPNCYEPKCHCKPRICPAPPPLECDCCKARNDDPVIRHAKSSKESQASIMESFAFRCPKTRCTGNDLESCSRTPSRLRFDMRAHSNKDSA